MLLLTHTALCTLIALNTPLLCILPDAGGVDVHHVIAAQCTMDENFMGMLDKKTVQT